MITDDLHQALERATDAVEPVGIAAPALATARQRRTRRRGLAAGVVSAAAVVGVVVAAQGARVTDSEPARPPAASTPASPDASPDASPGIILGPDEIPIAPMIATDRIQPMWDPRGVEALPLVDLGLPRVLPVTESGSVTRAVALLVGDAEALLVGEDGAQEQLKLPEGLGDYRSLQVSPNGRRVAANGLSGLFWRELDGGTWQRMELRGPSTGEATVSWLPDSDSVVLSDFGPGLRIDVSTGEQETLPELRSYVPWAADPAGLLTYHRQDAQGAIVSELEDGRLRETWLGPLESIQRYVVSDTSLAAARADGGYYGARRTADDHDGLIALERETLTTRAFLPVPTAKTNAWYSHTLTALAWLDDDTVLFTVLPKDASEQHLATWNVDSGELSRISRWPQDLRVSFATDLLRSSMQG